MTAYTAYTLLHRRRHVAQSTAFYWVLYYCILWTLTSCSTASALGVECSTSCHVRGCIMYSVQCIQYTVVQYTVVVCSLRATWRRRWSGGMQYMQSCSSCSIHCTELSWADLAEHECTYCNTLQYTASTIPRMPGPLACSWVDIADILYSRKHGPRHSTAS